MIVTLCCITVVTHVDISAVMSDDCAVSAGEQESLSSLFAGITFLVTHLDRSSSTASPCLGISSQYASFLLNYVCMVRLLLIVTCNFFWVFLLLFLCTACTMLILILVIIINTLVPSVL